MINHQRITRKAWYFLAFLWFLIPHMTIRVQAQAQVWRHLQLNTFPNHHLTGIEIGFRAALLEGIKTNQIPIYKYTGKFADFAQPIPHTQAIRAYLNYYEPEVQDTFSVRGVDFREMELQEKYYPRRKGKQKFEIQAISLMAPIFKKDSAIKFTLKYTDFKQYLNKLYATSRQAKNLKTLRAYWQSPEDPTLQTSVPTALEARKFVSKVTKTRKLKRKHRTQLEQLVEYSPQQQTNWFTIPKFIRLGKGKLRANVRYKVNLLEAENFALYRQGQGIVYELLKGTLEGKIQAYEYNFSPLPIDYKMNKGDLDMKCTYLDNAVQDSVRLYPGDMSELRLEGFWEVDTRKGTSQFKIYIVSFFIPQGTNSETSLGPIAMAQFKYSEVKAYFEQRFKEAQKTGRYFASWVDPHDTRKRMSFSAALDQGLFAKEILWYANQQADDLFTFTHWKIEHLSLEEKGKRYRLMQKQVQQNLENFTRK